MKRHRVYIRATLFRLYTVVCLSIHQNINMSCLRAECELEVLRVREHRNLYIRMYNYKPCFALGENAVMAQHNPQNRLIAELESNQSQFEEFVQLRTDSENAFLVYNTQAPIQSASWRFLPRLYPHEIDQLFAGTVQERQPICELLGWELDFLPEVKLWTVDKANGQRYACASKARVLLHALNTGH